VLPGDVASQPITNAVESSPDAERLAHRAPNRADLPGFVERNAVNVEDSVDLYRPALQRGR
jgi:hypothetical protein